MSFVIVPSSLVLNSPPSFLSHLLLEYMRDIAKHIAKYGHLLWYANTSPCSSEESLMYVHTETEDFAESYQTSSVSVWVWERDCLKAMLAVYRHNCIKKMTSDDIQIVTLVTRLLIRLEANYPLQYKYHL